MSKPNAHTVTDGYELIQRFGPDSPRVADYLRECDPGTRRSLETSRILAREMGDPPAEDHPEVVVVYCVVAAMIMMGLVLAATILRH